MKEKSTKRIIVICALVITILSSVLSFLQIKNAIIHTEKVKLNELLEFVHNKIVQINSEVKKGKLSKESAQKIILDEMPLYMSKNGKNFIWINDYNNNVLFNPTLKVGSNCAKIKDKRGTCYYNKLTEIAKNRKNNFLFYKDIRALNNEGAEKVNKLSTAIAFPEWEWVIGTGVYFDEINSLANKMLFMIICFSAALFILIVLVMNWLYVLGIIKLLNTLPYPAWYKDNKNTFLLVNNAYLNYMNLKLIDVINKKEKDVCEKFNITKTVLEEDKSFNYEKGIYIKEEISLNGQKKYVQNLTLKLLDAKNSVQGYVGCYVDITQKQLIEEIKAEFVSIVSHELRTPLTSIIGSLELTNELFASQLPQKVHELLTIASKNAERLKGIINNILNMDKIETDMMVYNCENYHFNDIIEETVKGMTLYAKDFDVKLRICNLNQDDFIYTDKEKLQQIILNILSNAVKFSKKEAFVDISTYQEDNKLILSVTNYDNPIPNEFKDKIFGKFTQCNNNDNKSTYGSGLGLYITKRLTVKMGGDVWYTSNEQETTFFISMKKSIYNSD